MFCDVAHLLFRRNERKPPEIPETLFQRIKTHLERETQRTGRKLTQREFVLGLIEEALEAAERQGGRPGPGGAFCFVMLLTSFSGETKRSPQNIP